MSRIVSVIAVLGGALIILSSQVSWAAPPCGNVTYTGCCSGTTAKYCKNGALVTKDCTKDSYGPACGWATALKAYSCNKTATKDPNGKYERDCSKLPAKPDGGVTTKDAGSSKKDAATGPSCGKITSSGCCDGTSVKYCSSGVLKSKSCVGSKYGSLCGWVKALSGYGCSKTATADPNGKYPLKCGGSTTVDAGATKKDTGSSAACGSITAKGCCQGETAKFCASGKLSSKACSGSTPKCGWDTTKKFYTCGTSGLSDPAGTYAKACGGATQKDTGSVFQKDQGSTAKKDTGAVVNPPKKDDSGSCSVSSSASSSGLALTLILLALALRRRRR